MRFSLFGVPVVVRPMFLVVAVLLGNPSGTSRRELAELASWIAILFVSILVHEFGHAIAMRAFGGKPSIELWGLGGLTHWGSGGTASAGRHIVVSLAGPGAGFLLGAGVLLVASHLSLERESLSESIVHQALFINIGWGAVNLLPILPLDGGHAFEWTLAAFLGERGRRAARGLSLALAVAAGGYALYHRALWLGFLAFWCASISYRALVAKPGVGGGGTPQARDPRFVEAAREVWRLLVSGDAESAAKLCRALLAALPEGAPERNETLELLAWAEIEAGNERAALEAGRQIRGMPSELLQARLLIADGRLADGLPRLERAYYNGRDSFAALVLSSVYVDQERPDLALEMLVAERGKRLSSETHLTISAQLFHAERWELALKASELGWQRFGEPRHAYNAACSLARLGRVEEGIARLADAVTAGFGDASMLGSDPDLEALRAHPRFAEILESAKAKSAEAPG